jgi:hypothetical protein
VVCKDNAALYAYLTGKIAALEGVQRVETVPVIHWVKQLTNYVLRP